MEWFVKAYQSGTVVVTRDKVAELPWFDIHGEVGFDEIRKFPVADDICTFCNGGPRAVWLDDLHIVTPNKAETVDRVMVFVCGPMYDADPPKLNWRTDDSEDAVDAREQLMLWLVSGYKPAAQQGREDG